MTWLVAIPAALELADDLVDLAELRVPEYALADHDHNDVEKARAEVVAVENALTAAIELRALEAEIGDDLDAFNDGDDEVDLIGIGQRTLAAEERLDAALAVVRSLTKGT